MWMGAATVELPGIEGCWNMFGVGAESEPVWYACDATACNSADARAGLGEAEAACWSVSSGGADGGVGATPATERLNIASNVGRRAAPKGVERKSEGRSGGGFKNPVRRNETDSYTRTFDPRRYAAASEDANAVVCKRVAVKVCEMSTPGRPRPKG